MGDLQLEPVSQLHVVAVDISCALKACDRAQVHGAVPVLKLPQAPQVAQLVPCEVGHVLPPLLKYFAWALRVIVGLHAPHQM